MLISLIRCPPLFFLEHSSNGHSSNGCKKMDSIWIFEILCISQFSNNFFPDVLRIILLLCSVAACLAYWAKFGVSHLITGIAGAAAAATDPGLRRGPARPATWDWNEGYGLPGRTGIRKGGLQARVDHIRTSRAVPEETDAQNNQRCRGGFGPDAHGTRLLSRHPTPSALSGTGFRGVRFR